MKYSLRFIAFLLVVAVLLTLIPLAFDLHLTFKTLKGGVKNLGAAMFSVIAMIPLLLFAAFAALKRGS
jgi:hypothetical protein